MIAEVVKIFNHDLLDNFQVSNQDVGLLTNVVPGKMSVIGR